MYPNWLSCAKRRGLFYWYHAPHTRVHHFINKQMYDREQHRINRVRVKRMPNKIDFKIWLGKWCCCRRRHCPPSQPPPLLTRWACRLSIANFRATCSPLFLKLCSCADMWIWMVYTDRNIKFIGEKWKHIAQTTKRHFICGSCLIHQLQRKQIVWNVAPDIFIKNYYPNSSIHNRHLCRLDNIRDIALKNNFQFTTNSWASRNNICYDMRSLYVCTVTLLGHAIPIWLDKFIGDALSSLLKLQGSHLVAFKVFHHGMHGQMPHKMNVFMNFGFNVHWMKLSFG